ncbi:2',3'-cyclic-nucleotide 2'-phosphodiesterase/5'-or 3'-nucleotidase, 5'-nucleotidase family [Halorubrum xinjiangense]|uniref:2',3'-cyclic-nucleotide 2'-phosphodiesterase/5'-or 3'-nucleotidase, 5'-nucleotidase family n=1 Tax=Halorubrum xinjiangense TaxID=261291 RepID=A0A1G7N0S9_9EURY|nr:5'-nucleotidase C-terminal domain-containing protein [Halorubrum xinjiangense]SDF67634.1 2',3'-cyclic-nucleotide 2'-phosphodiesterase/5'-or 3'-nucleotidase, 5'-nucleotidase family [Halorubrum xinjiangense]
MNVHETDIGDWRTLDGAPVDGDPVGGDTDDADAVFAHVSDLHGQLTPRHQVYYDNPTSGPEFDFGDDDRVIERGGGIPLLAAKLDELREAYDACTLMSGDTFHGSAVTAYTDGRAMLAPVNGHVAPDVYVPGNWDYSNEAAEDGAFLELMDDLDAPILANNLYDWETEERLYDAYRVFEVGGLSVGVVGMTNVYVDRMAPAFYEGKYRFGKHPALLEESARAAREDGADVVVAVTEIGLPWMVQAAKDCPSVDVAFSAHTHEYTYDPIVVEETETVVVESGMGDALGRVDLRVRDGKVQFRHRLYCLTEDGEHTPEPDADAAETVEAVRAPFFEETPGFERGAGTLDRSLETVVGRTEKSLSRQSLLESAWNTLFNDALRAHFDTDLAVSHGFRYGTAVPPGDVTLGELYTFFPMTTPVARGVAYGQQLTTHMERFLEDSFTPYPYDQEDGRVRNFSSNVEVTIDPTAKRGRRLVELRVDGETVDPEETYSVATFRRPGDPERDLGNCGFPFRDVEVDDGTIPVDVIAEYLDEHSPVDYEVTGLVETAEDGGRAQNTPADGPYPFIQPGVDYASGEAYCETAMIPRGNAFPEAGRNRTR